MPEYLSRISEGVVLHLKVLPRSSRNQLAGVHNGEIKLKLTAPPVEGAANKCCCDYLAKILQIPVSRVEIIAGATSQHKKVLVRDVDVVEVVEKLSIKD